MLNPLLLTDGYKTSHHKMYPEGTRRIYSNLTARSDKYAPNICKNKGVVVFGMQKAIMDVDNLFKDFFKSDKDESIESVKRILKKYLGQEYDVSHFEKLHDLGYLPIEVRWLEEGTICPIGVPMFTINNTHDDFPWITNFVETLISLLLWKPITVATIARGYREILLKYAHETCDNISHVNYQAHDFSMRGLDSIDASVSVGLAFLTSFRGSDTLPVLEAVGKYYSDYDIANGVPAAEHSCICAGGQDTELETFERLMDVYPKGILSIVSDTWDFWNVIDNYLPKLKSKILERDGTMVIRPDSGNPVDIICGKITLIDSGMTSEDKGLIESLWDIFGGTINSKGYKVLNPKIGAIYGDSITPERAEEICRRLKEKGFASSNIVLGVGSYSLNMNSRDTFGIAIKATAMIDKDGNLVSLQKNPKTDDGTKKSAKGLTKVIRTDDGYKLIEGVTLEEFEADDNELKIHYVNGELVRHTLFGVIKKNLAKTYDHLS